MTDLTEQWKKGELDIDECYFAETEGGIYKATGEYLNSSSCINGFDITSILESVPTYEEWQASEKYNKHLEEVIKVYEQKDKQATETSIAHGELLEENEKLKELLNKAFVYVHDDCLKNLRVGYTPLSALLVKDIIKALKDYRRKNATEFIYVEDDKEEVLNE